MLADDVQRSPPRERQPPDDGLEKYDAHRVQIARASIGSPRACSGAMYSGVPQISQRPVDAGPFPLGASPAALSPSPSTISGSMALARPKSQTFAKSGSPSRSIRITFPGLRSR